MQVIESSANKKIKWLTSLKKKKVRLEEDLFLIEGTKSVSEAVNEGSPVVMVLVSANAAGGLQDLTEKAEVSGIPVYITDDRIFIKCSSLKTPQGILAAIGKRDITLDSILAKAKPVVVLDGIGDPGNLGTIIRTADAFGFGGVLLLPGCADAYSPKTVQASMGSILRTDICNMGYDDIEYLADNGYDLLGMHLDGKPMHCIEVKNRRTAVVIGSESHGLSPESIAKCKMLIKIDMPGDAESLNAAIAAGIVMNKVVSENG